SFHSSATRIPQVQHMLDVIAKAPLEGGAWCGGHPDPAAGWTEGKIPPMPATAVVMGDMNFTHSSDEYTLMTGPVSPYHGRLYSPGHFVDAWVAAGHAEDSGQTHPAGHRIDHCFVSSSLNQCITGARVDTDATGSDHWPLWVELNLPAT
ncbi:MAG: endonuclease/exonuclease/phosphatase family protein, partial [Pseudomonadota bacterium]